VGEFDEKFKFNTFSQAPNGGDISRKINFPRIIISTETFSTSTSLKTIYFIMSYIKEKKKKKSYNFLLLVLISTFIFFFNFFFRLLLLLLFIYLFIFG